MNNKILTLVITLTLGIILTASLLVPIINDAQDGQRITYNNVGLNANLVGNESVTYTWEAGTGITIGDDVIAANQSANGPNVLFFSDSGWMKTNFASTVATYYEFDGTINAISNITAATITVDPATKTITISNVTASTTVDDTSFNYSEWALIPAVSGDYVFWAPYSTSKVMHQDDDAKIYAAYNSGGTWAVSFANGAQTTKTGTVEYTTNFDGAPIEGYEGIVDYSVGSNATDGYTITVSDTAAYAQVMAFERSATGVAANNGNEIISLLGVLPILVIIGLVLMAVRAITLRNE